MHGTADTLCCLRAAFFLLEEEDETEKNAADEDKKAAAATLADGRVTSGETDPDVLFPGISAKKQRRGLSAGESTCGSSGCLSVNTEETKLDVEKIF